MRFHALQALWYQVAWIGIFVAYFLVASVLSVIMLGITAVILFPLMTILPFAPLAHGCYAAYKVSQGEDYWYPFVADRIDGGTHRVAYKVQKSSDRLRVGGSWPLRPNPCPRST